MRNSKIRKLVQTSVLVAIMIIMHMTFGYISTPAIEMCLMGVPVIIGAIIIGPAAGALLGGLFGLSSLLTCFGIGHPSPFGALIWSLGEWQTVITCIVPRILMGLLVGLIFAGLKRIDRTKIISFIVAGLSGALLNTVLFMGSVALFFGEPFLRSLSGEAAAAGNIVIVIGVLVGLQGLIEAAVCVVISVLVSKVLYHVLPSGSK